MTDKERISAENSKQEIPLDVFGDVDLQKLMLVVRKSLVWIILIILISILASYLYLRYTVPVYESTSTLKSGNKK